MATKTKNGRLVFRFDFMCERFQPKNSVPNHTPFDINLQNIIDMFCTSMKMNSTNKLKVDFYTVSDSARNASNSSVTIASIL